jgi:hypothetical protein
MQADAIELVPFAPHHQEGALARQAGWPHHLEDWAPVLLSRRAGRDAGPPRQHTNRDIGAVQCRGRAADRVASAKRRYACAIDFLA